MADSSMAPSASVPEYPHEYKAQRRMERMAQLERERCLTNGGSLPPVCGFVYKPRGNRTKVSALDLTTCYRPAGSGTAHRGRGYCDFHEVWAVRETGKHSQIAAARTVAYQQARFFGAPMNIGPHEALQMEVARTAGIVAWLESKLQKLKEDGTPDDKVLTQYNAKMGFVPSVWMALYQEERAKLVAVSTAAIKAGVAERRVQIAEQQGRILAHLLMNFLHDPELGLTPHQMLAGPGIVRKHLALLPTTELSTAPDAIEAAFSEH